MRYAYVVAAGLNEEVVSVYDDERAAIKFAGEYGEAARMRVFRYQMNSQKRVLVWMAGATESQIEEYNRIMPDKFVKTTELEYAQALHKIIELMPHVPLEKVAERIDRPMEWVREILRKYPKQSATPPIVEASKDTIADVEVPDSGELSDYPDW